MGRELIMLANREQLSPISVISPSFLPPSIHSSSPHRVSVVVDEHVAVVQVCHEPENGGGAADSE